MPKDLRFISKISSRRSVLNHQFIIKRSQSLITHSNIWKQLEPKNSAIFKE